MLLKLTVHAQIRLFERGFSIDDLKKVIRNPDKVEYLLDGCVKIWKKLEDKSTLKIVYKMDNLRNKKGAYIIITAYFTSD